MVDGNRDGSEISFVLTFLYRFDFLEPCQCIITWLQKWNQIKGGWGWHKTFRNENVVPYGGRAGRDAMAVHSHVAGFV